LFSQENFKLNEQDSDLNLDQKIYKERIQFHLLMEEIQYINNILKLTQRTVKK
jgi:hypothetical protein